jgi:hypothetical protein
MFIPYVRTRTTERVHELAHGSEPQKYKQPRQQSKSALEVLFPPKSYAHIHVYTQLVTLIWR